MDATVIIPTYHCWDTLQICLDCLADQTIDAAAFEVIVVNNDPADNPPTTLRLPSNAKIVSEAKPGSYAARNRGIEAAQADIFFFTDSDCQPDINYIKNGIEIVQQNSEIGRFGGDVVLIPNGADWTAVELYDRYLGLEQQKWVERGRAVTANLIVCRRTMENVGKFNDTVLSGGDMEWNDRATAAGESIKFSQGAVVSHPARASLKEHITKTRRIEGARLRRNASRGFVNYIPPIQKVIPSFRTLRQLRKIEDLSLGQVMSVWGVHYVLRLVKISETIRLLWLRQPDIRT
ncbi:MAG: glycosyltransferase [Ruegeria sp.]